MNQANTTFSIEIGETQNRCPIGETVGNRNIAQGKIPVLSCEGACIRGQIARLAANMLAKQEPFARGCHGELFSVPDSAMARWHILTPLPPVRRRLSTRCWKQFVYDAINKKNIASILIKRKAESECSAWITFGFAIVKTEEAYEKIVAACCHFHRPCDSLQAGSWI